MLRPTNNRALLAYFDAIKNLRFRQLALILKTGYDPNLMLNGRGQNGLQFMINYFSATDAHLLRLQVPANKAAYLNIAKLLLDTGLDPNAIDLLTGESVIFEAIRINDKEMVSLLLNYVDLSLRNKESETALMCAARFGSKQVLRLILAHLHELELDDYFLRQRNRFGLSALDLARAENLECAKVLTKHLIAVGQPTAAKLTRSSSHHQLLASIAPSMRFRTAAASGPARTLAASLYADPLASDYESDFDVAAGPSFAPAGLARAGRFRPSMDSRAAEFNQYLMSDHGQQHQHQQQQQSSSSFGGASYSGFGQLTSNTSDEEDYYQPSYAPGGLTRSRSCIVGPQSSEAKGRREQSSGKFTGSSANNQAISGKSK